jgi:pimeloyl-ACP methyl ester carboxylesterase
MESFDLIAYDRRGYQGSRGLVPLGLEFHVDDLLALARREAEKGPVLYFGHSFGGVVALGAALRDPALSQQVIAYEAPLPWVRHRENSRSFRMIPSTRPKCSFDAWSRIVPGSG